jgi:hypothetical protein
MREAACAAKEAELAAALARQAAIGESVKRGGDEAVSLSIGGTLFTVTRGALTSIDDSFFTVLLSGRFTTRITPEGAFFVDRDPAHFPALLAYLRCGEISR